MRLPYPVRRLLRRWGVLPPLFQPKAVLIGDPVPPLCVCVDCRNLVGVHRFNRHEPAPTLPDPDIDSLIARAGAYVRANNARRTA